MALITKSQLISALGGDVAAAQLLDRNQDGVADDDLLDEAVAEAVGDVEAAYGARYASFASNPSAKLQRIAKQLAVYYSWGKGASNLAMPEIVRQLYGAARQDLKDIESSASGPGGSPLSRYPSDLDNSDGGRRAVYSTFRRAGVLGGR